MSDEFDPYYSWLGIPPKDQPPNHYRLLGIELFESNLDVIESAAFRQMGHVRTYQGGKNSKQSQQLLNELSAAKICLLAPEQKEAYDQLLRSTLDSLAAFLPDQPDEATALSPAVEPATPSVHVFDSETDDGPGNTVRNAASMSGIRRKPTKSFSQTSIVIGVVVLVVCIGIAAMFGSKFLGRGNSNIAEYNPQPAPSPPPSAPVTEVIPPVANPEPVVTADDDPPASKQSPSGSADAPPRRIVVAEYNETTRSIPTPPPHFLQMKLRAPPNSILQRIVDESSGILQADFALMQSMSHVDLVRSINMLRSAVYRPLRIRPYTFKGETRIASTWTRDAKAWRIVFGVDKAALTVADRSMRQQGYQPIDVASWDAEGAKFVAIWSLENDGDQNCKMMLDVSEDELQVEAATARAEGYMPRSNHVRYDANGERSFCVIWHQPTKAVSWHHWAGDRVSHEAALKRPGAPQDVSMTFDANGSLVYAGLSIGLPDPDALELHGYSADDHLAQCKQLALQGYRPVAIAAATRPVGGNTVTASVWQKEQPPSIAANNSPPASSSAPSTTAKATHALRFDGADSLTIPGTSELASFQQEFTAEMWFRFTDLTPTASNILMGSAAFRELNPAVTSGRAAGWFVIAGPRQNTPDQSGVALRWASASGGIIGVESSSTPFGTDWHHFAVSNVRIGNASWRANVFVDGRRTHATLRPTVEAATSPSDLFVGKGPYVKYQLGFRGDVKAFRLSSNARYQDTFSPPKAFTTDATTLALLDFSGGSDSKLADISVHNRSGIIDGAEWVSSSGSVTAPMVAGNPSLGDLVAAPKAPVVQERLPVPSGADLKAAREEVADVFSSDLEAARTKQEKSSLAKDLLQRGKEEQDAVSKFALMHKAWELAQAAVALDVSLDSIEEITAWFDVEPVSLKVKTMATLADSAKSDIERRTITRGCLELADEAISATHWDAAAKMITAAAKARSRLKDQLLLEMMNDRRDRLKALKPLWDAAERASVTLATSPDDGSANYHLGRYECFVVEDWQSGLPRLAKGNNDALAVLAKQELEKPDAEAAMDLADGWFNWGEDAKEPDKRAALLRAKKWYVVAEQEVGGLKKAQATKQLEKIGELVEAAASVGRNLAWLDVPPGEVKQLIGHTAEVTSIDVNQSGSMLVSGSTDGTVRLWDLADGKETGLIQSSVRRIKTVALLKNDSLILVIGDGATAEVWNARTGRPADAIKIPSSVRSSALSSQANVLACGQMMSSSSTGNITLYNTATGLPVGNLNCPRYPLAMSVSPFGRLIAAGSSDDNIYVWDIGNLKMAAPFTGLGRQPNAVEISPDEQLVAACNSTQAMVWELATGKMVSRIPVTTSSFYRLAFSPDSRRLLLGTSMAQVEIYNVKDGNKIDSLTGNRTGTASTYTRDLRYLPDPRGAVSAGYDGVIRVWRLPD